MANSEPYILLFDGVCNLCNRVVLFTIRNDKDKKFRFAALQSERGQAMLRKFDLPTHDFGSFVLIHGEKYFLKSSAGLHVLKELGFPWKLFYIFIIFPRLLRDFIYNIISKSRYSVFGKRDTCMTPTPELKQRFLE